jgi:signal peptidase I
MEPTLHCARPGPGCEGKVDDVVLARPFRTTDARRGAILIFQSPPIALPRCGAGGLFIKRLIGLPGETVREVHGFIWINGKRLREPYIKSDRRDTETHPARKIAKGTYFMMGDNRAESCDSRIWGPVPKRNLLWTAVSIDRDGTIIPIH